MGTRRTAAIRIGCSGWVYAHWRERFYPSTMPQKDWFRHYAQTFDTVEINNSFYHLPGEQAVASWARQAPPGFLYAVKVNRFITHMKKLKDPETPLQNFITRMQGLGHHLGPLLYQLPPHWTCNRERFRAFLEALPRDLTHVFEFRHPSWLNEAVFSDLDAHRVSLCVHDMAGIDIPRLAIGPVVYVRFHGSGVKYGGGYPLATLRSWARWLRQQAADGRTAYAYFNNDVDAHAIFDAQTLRAELGRAS